MSKEWVQNGYDVTIFSSSKHHLVKSKYPKFKNSFLKENIDGIKIIWLKLIDYNYAYSFKRILSWIQFEIKLLLINKKNLSKPDVIIVSSLSIFSIINGVFFRGNYKSRLIFEIRDIWPQSLIEIQKFSKKNPLIIILRWIEKFGYNNSNVIVGTMPNLKEHINSSIKKPTQCKTIPQGIREDYSKYLEKLPINYAENYIPKNKFIFAYTGSINKNNPIDTFLEIASEIKDSKIHFLILGDGDRKKHLVRNFSSFNNISFPPYIEKKYVVDFLSHASVCIDSLLPGIGKYGISRNKWIDYMIASKPIICYYEGYQSIINEAKCGDFVEFGNTEALRRTLAKYTQNECQ